MRYMSMIYYHILLSLDAAAAYAYRDHAQLQLIGKHFESGICRSRGHLSLQSVIFQLWK